EFFWLGMALCGVLIGASRKSEGVAPLLSHPPVCGALLFSLLTAVTDEYIQSFTGRTSSVSDVLLDFSGALCGLGLTALTVYLVRRICALRAQRRG
ncbi:MAG: VanZ family protein, partial [Clostridia bacterium]|nr:VanZ family protein [Clostridia bacterium]